MWPRHMALNDYMFLAICVLLKFPLPNWILITPCILSIWAHINEQNITKYDLNIFLSINDDLYITTQLWLLHVTRKGQGPRKKPTEIIDIFGTQIYNWLIAILFNIIGMRFWFSDDFLRRFNPSINIYQKNLCINFRFYLRSKKKKLLVLFATFKYPLSK